MIKRSGYWQDFFVASLVFFTWKFIEKVAHYNLWLNELFDISFLIILPAACICAFLNAYRRKLGHEIEALRSMDATLRAVPDPFTMHTRSDSFLINRDGSANVEFEFECAASSDISETFYYKFPLYASRHDNRMPLRPSIEIVTCRVNDSSIDAQLVQYEFNEVRRRVERGDDGYRWHNESPTECGYVVIPITFKGSRSARVNFCIRLNQAFVNYRESEYIIVDVPYVTSKLTVEVRPFPGGELQRATAVSSCVEASSLAMLSPDARESERESGHVRMRGDSWMWTTESALLGYRYRIVFKISEPASPSE